MPVTKDKIASTFGEVLRNIRSAKGLSQETLAKKSLLDRTYISLLERGLRQPSLKTIFDLSLPLDISPAEMVELTENKHYENNQKRNSRK